MATHGVIDMPQPNSPAKVTPRLDGNVSEWPRAENGGAVKSDGRTVTNAPGPYTPESPRQPRDR